MKQRAGISLFELFRKIWKYVLPYKWLVIITLILTLVSSLTSQVNAIVLDRTVDAINSLTGSESFAWSRAVKILTIITIVLLGKEILAALVRFAQRYYGERMRILVSKDLAQAVIEKMLTFRMAFFTANGNEAGKLQTRIDRGVDSLTMTVKNFFIDLLPMCTSAVIALVLMFAANVYVGITALCIVPLYFLITWLQAQKLRGWRQAMRRYREQKSNGIMNIIESINVIKSFNRERIEGDKQLELQDCLTANQMETRKVSYLFDGLKSFVEQVGTVLIIILTAFLVLKGYPGMSIGKIMYHVMLFSNVSAPIKQLQRIFDDMNEALVYAEGFFEIIDSDDEVEPAGKQRPEKISGRFELEHVDFTYPNGNKALHDITMSIQPGKITAFVGLSGAGKSTIVNLLDKFYEPDSGSIKLDGIDLRDYDTKYLREHIGLVLQKNHIFEGSIEENIKYGKPDATHAEVLMAAKKAYLYDQVIALPDGFRTKATLLSGGQQQRVAIARMFLKNPPIIFLDEPTASLDAVATEQIKNSIEAIKQNRTVIIISHNISQIIDSDVIYALKNGRVEQGGEPDEVYKQGGIYKEILDASARSLNVEKIAKTIEESSLFHSDAVE